ncbi:10945_t:CDS:2, partial [Scutellospora calospora]
GDSDENRFYAMKECNPCVKHKKRECKCHHGDDICEICNDKCPEKTKARIEGSKDKIGPFDFGDYRYLAELERKKNKEFDAIIEGNEMLINGATLLEVFRYNRDKVTYSSNYSNMSSIHRDIKREKRMKRGYRIWRPPVFYFYGESGSGKTSLIEELFGDELFSKDEKIRGGASWWNGYEGHQIVLIDEFYTKFDWNSMINLLNDSKCNLHMKYGLPEPFVPFIIFLTSPKPPEEAYNFGQNGHKEDSNKRNFRQFVRRLNFVVEFSGFWDDDIEKRTTSISFRESPLERVYWGNEEEFRSMNWDIKFKRGKCTIEQTVKKAEMFTEGIEGEYFDVDGKVYWRRKFPDYLKRYLRDYPKCKEMSEYVEESNKEQNKNNLNINSKRISEELVSSDSNKKRRYDNENEEMEIDDNSDNNVTNSDVEY